MGIFECGIYFAGMLARILTCGHVDDRQKCLLKTILSPRPAVFSTRGHPRRERVPLTRTGRAASFSILSGDCTKGPASGSAHPDPKLRCLETAGNKEEKQGRWLQFTATCLADKPSRFHHWLNRHSQHSYLEPPADYTSFGPTGATHMHWCQPLEALPIFCTHPTWNLKTTPEASSGLCSRVNARRQPKTPTPTQLSPTAGHPHGAGPSGVAPACP